MQHRWTQSSGRLPQLKLSNQTATIHQCSARAEIQVGTPPSLSPGWQREDQIFTAASIKASQGPTTCSQTS